MRQRALFLTLNYIMGAEGRGGDTQEGQGAGYKMISAKVLVQEIAESSSVGEPHPHPLPESDMSFSCERSSRST